MPTELAISPALFLGWALPHRERLHELGAGIIVVEHGTSELWGMESLAAYVGDTFPELTVHYLDHHPRPWTVAASASTLLRRTRQPDEPGA